ncbi:hypothetical protein [Roseospira navarrensis]|uniref:Uncharacterized protein n=1 Tax=Roseospira navarrensis TaxID=140058 RepID=A0A7X1ZE16_9PROT|nr:hypothetical protein [Roseospira navarrensis]MQX35851.1 hypothetical protein [Roseospira navarrensis]
MGMTTNRYTQAAREDVQALKEKWDDMRQHVPSDGGDDTPDSRIADTVWQDFEAQSNTLREAGSNASDETQSAYEAARDKVARIIESDKSR